MDHHQSLIVRKRRTEQPCCDQAVLQRMRFFSTVVLFLTFIVLRTLPPPFRPIYPKILRRFLFQLL